MSAAPQGHNLPRLDEILTPDVVQDLIDAELEPLIRRAAELIAMCGRFREAYPEITSIEADAKAAEVLAVCQRMTAKSGRVETARVALKAPILAASDAIGSDKRGPFATIIGRIEEAVRPIAAATVVYKQKVEDRARAEIPEDGNIFDTLDVIDAKTADLTRVHGEVGTTSLKYVRRVTIEDPDAVERIYCVPDPALLKKAAGKPGTPIRAIKGCFIEDVPDLNIRS
jgi:hypothetical protein